MRTVSKELLTEIFAELLHDTWLTWTTPLCEANKVSKEIQQAWKDYRKVYFDLNEPQKNFYRDAAKKFVRALERAGLF
jgi:hypothetical protein